MGNAPLEQTAQRVTVRGEQSAAEAAQPAGEEEDGEGDATIAGLRVHVGGQARITLDKNGLPVVKILDLSLPVPGPIRQAIEDELQVQLQRADRLPVRFISAEWRDGEVTVRGVIR